MATSTEMKTALDAGDTERFRGIVDRRRNERMAQFDGLPADVRACANDYGWRVVKTMLDLGITKSRHIRHVVETILDEFSPTRGTSTAQGPRTELAKAPTYERIVK